MEQYSTFYQKTLKNQFKSETKHFEILEKEDNYIRVFYITGQFSSNMVYFRMKYSLPSYIYIYIYITVNRLLKMSTYGF